MTEEERSPVEAAVAQAMDAFVYAPLGLLFDAPTLYPRLVERGRNQVQAARMFGEFAVKMGRKEADRRLADVGSLLQTLTGSGPTPDAGATTDAPPSEEATEAPTTPAAPRPDASALAVPDYDSLSASQVVSRLSGLSPDELEQVRVYEAGTRARKTILSKVAQLQR